MSIEVVLIVKEEQLVRVQLRDNKRSDSPTITVGAKQWREFLPAALAWDCDTTIQVGGLTLRDTHMSDPVCITSRTLVHLHFGWDEWRAFHDRASQGHYDGPPILAAQDPE